MTGTFDGPDDIPRNDASAPAGPPRGTSAPTLGERVIVLGGFAVAAVYTAVSAALGFGMETAGAVWLAAVLWTIAASLACALRRGIRRRDWSAFTGYTLACGRDERIDWATQTGSYAWEPIAEEHERLMRGD